MRWIVALALCLVTTQAKALAIEGPFAAYFEDDSAAPSSEQQTTGLYFSGPFTYGDPQPVMGRLFPTLLLSPATLGTTVFADASDGAEFAKAVASLTDGQDGTVEIGVPPPPGSAFQVSFGSLESQIFAADPLGTGGPDLAGFEIKRIGFRYDGVISIPGADLPPGRAEYAFTGTLFFVPEPSSLAPCGAVLAMAALLGRRR
jgi:hypothetical protein